MAGEVGDITAGVGGTSLGGGLSSVAEGGLGGASISGNVTEGTGIPASISPVESPAPSVDAGLKEAQDAFGGPAALGPDVAPLVGDLDKSLEENPEAGIKELAGANVDAGNTGAVPTEEPTGDGGVATQAETTAPPAGQEMPATAAYATEAAETEEATKPQAVEANGGQQTAETQSEDSAKPQEAQTATPEDADKLGKINALQEKIDNKTATADEIKELRNLKQDPEQRRAGLEQKAKDGTITDEEADELGKLNAEGKDKAQELTPEQKLEKLNKDIEDLGTEIMTKYTKGEPVSPEDLRRLQELRGEAAMINTGFTPDQARNAIRNALGTQRTNERQTAAMKEVQDKIQELMSLEIQLKTIPDRISTMRKQRDDIKNQAAAKHRQVEGASTPEQRLQLRGEEVNLYMQIATANQRIVGQKYEGDRINASISDLEQYIRRKTGVTSGATAFVEWAGAKTRNVYTEAKINVSEELDYRFGNF